MYVLRRLKIKQFRALSAPVELHFTEHANLILGLNGSGKTNFLKLISMVCRFDFTAQPHSRRSAGALRRLRARHPACARDSPYPGMVVTHLLRVIVVTEDGAGDAHEVIQALLKRIFRELLEPRAQNQRIDFKPAADDTPSGRARAAVLRGNLWKNKKPTPIEHTRMVQLCRFLADQLRETALPVFVVHHYDGDTKWSERAKSFTPKQWEERIVKPVKELHAGRGDVNRLVDFVPHYSIEAWLYQHDGKLASIAERERASLVSEPPDGWEEAHKPKEHHDWLRDHFNRELATAFPVKKLYGVNRCFAAAVEKLRGVPGLLEALAMTA